jgi:uncharacterized protein YjbI with pentapeptide repeats
MKNTAAERIRAMLDKGTITKEQADELLNALAEAEADGGAADQAEGSPSDRATGDAPQAGTPRVGGPETSGPRESRDDSWGPRDDGRYRGRRRSRSFLDMDWVGDMVDGITSGLGVGTDAGPRPPASDDRSGDNYRYEWDPRWGRRRGGNAENSSRVEQPEGEAFEFQENRVVFSKIAGLHLVRAKIRDNSFSASTFKGADLTDSAIVDSSLAGASVHDLLMDRAELKDVVIAGSKITRMEMRSGAAMKNVKISGSPVSSFTLEGDSRIEDTRLAGVVVSGCSLSRKTRIKDTRFNGSSLNGLTMAGVTLADTRVDGCTLGATRLEETEITGCVIRGVSLQDSVIIRSRIKDARLEAVGFAGLSIEGSELKNMVIRDAFEGRFPRKMEGLRFIDVKLDNVQLVGCLLRDTTFKGFSAEGIRIRGRDLSGRTFQSADELRALSER